MQDAFWGLSKGTPNRKQIGVGHQVVFYVASPDRAFAGTAQLASDYYETSDEERLTRSHGSDIYEAYYGVRLASIDIWSHSEPVCDLLPKLKFIKNHGRWWDYFRGGIRQVPEDDYSSITERSSSTLL